MRHRNKSKIFGRSYSQRNLLLRNLAISLILSERITTTLAKAKWLKPFSENLITTAKEKSLFARRKLLSLLNNKSAVSKLINDIAGRYQNHASGYLRIVKAGQRKGDGAPLAIIELIIQPPKEAIKKEKSNSSEVKPDKKKKGNGHDKKEKS